MNEARAAELASAIQHWLDYQVLCRRGMLVSEAYLAQPVGEYLRAHHSGEIRAEWSIPGLQTGARGRPRQLDYALLSRDSSRLVAAIEAKWVTSRRIEPQRIVDDLLRLESVRSDQGQSVTRFFLVAGLSSDFNAYFLNAQVRAGGVNHALLGPLLNQVAGQPLSVSVANSQDPWRGYFKSFAESHQTTVPTSFTTRFVADYPGTAARACVWRVSSVSNRSPVLGTSL